MSHPFGDLVSQHLHRKHGLSQSKLAAGILQEPSVITRMCRGERLTGPQARERVLAIIGWLSGQGALETTEEANALLDAAGMAGLRHAEPAEAAILNRLATISSGAHQQDVSEVRQLLHSNLSLNATPFIGRVKELRAVEHHLADTHCRLLTLAGARGVGKTRLAIEAALRRSRFYEDGAHFIDLQTVSDGDALSVAIADGLHMTLSGGELPLQQVLRYLAGRSLLLVLDNFEHLIRECSSVILQIVHAVQRVQLLITSREVLNLREEWQYWVEGVGCPDPDSLANTNELLEHDAVRLFVECARRVQQDFSLDQEGATVSNICRMTAGLPLAIEMAATWIRTLSTSQIANELEHSIAILHSKMRNAPMRHRSMQVVIDHSWQMLSAEDQGKFVRLAVFRGGFTRDAALQVADTNLDTLASLVDKSLLRRTSADRYILHEVIHQYLREKLAGSPEETQMRQKHLEYFCALAQAADRDIFGADQFAWVQQLEANHDNLREALDWCRNSPDRVGMGMRMSGALGWFWLLANSWFAGYCWAKQFVEQPLSHHADLKEDRALALFTAGGLAVAIDNYQDAIPYLEESVRLLRDSTDTIHLARSLCALGIAHVYQAKYDQALSYLASCTELLGGVDGEHGALFAQAYMGETYIGMGDFQKAHVVLQKCLELNQRLGYTMSLLQTLILLGRVERMLNKTTEAREHIQMCLEIADQAGILRFKSQALSSLAWLALEDPSGHNAYAHFYDSLRLYWRLADYMGVAESLEGVVTLIARRGNLPRAALIAGAAANLRTAINVPIPIEYRDEYLGLIENILLQPDAGELTQSHKRGQVMELGSLSVP